MNKWLCVGGQVSSYNRKAKIKSLYSLQQPPTNDYHALITADIRYFKSFMPITS